MSTADSMLAYAQPWRLVMLYNADQPCIVGGAWLCVKTTSLPAQVAEGLRTLMLGLYDVHLAPDGRSVDYPALVRDPNFADYIVAATELQKVSAQALT